MPEAPAEPEALTVPFGGNSLTIHERADRLVGATPGLRLVAEPDGSPGPAAVVGQPPPDLGLHDPHRCGNGGPDVHGTPGTGPAQAAPAEPASAGPDGVRPGCGSCLYTILAEASASLLAMHGADALDSLRGVLAKVGLAAGAERAYVYVTEPGAQAHRLLHEWRTPSHPAVPVPMPEIPVGSIQWGEDRLRELRPLVLPDTTELPRTAVRERAIFEARGVQSFVGVPLRLGETQYGFLALDCVTRRRVWPPQVVAVLGLLGQLVAAAFARARDEARVQRSEATLRELVEHAPLGIVRSALNGQLLAANPALARLLGFADATELVREGKVGEFYVQPQARRQVRDALRREGVVVGRELAWRRRDGTPVTILLSARAVHDAEGTPIAYEAFVEDISERRRLEATLRRAQRAELLGQLSGGLAHDLGNLLTVVTASATLLELELAEVPEGARRELDGLQAAIGRARELVLRLMAVGHSRVFDRRPVDLAATVRETADLLRRVLPESIQIAVDGAHDPMPVLGDRGALEQVLMNLGTNARDAMPGGGRLVFRLRRTASEHVLEVEDSGLGMSAEVRRRIFEPFFTTKSDGRGTGLGLSMVKSVMTQCDGSVEVESESGRGTRFILRCPTHAAGGLGPAVDRPFLRQGGTERILLVEDQHEIRRVAQRLLEHSGYLVETCEDGQTALSRLQHGGALVDLVITDVVMPGLSGFELREAARRVPRCPRFLFTSGYAPQELPGLATGGAGFVQKPWTRDELLGRVREMLDQPAGEVAA